MPTAEKPPGPPPIEPGEVVTIPTGAGVVFGHRFMAQHREAEVRVKGVSWHNNEWWVSWEPRRGKKTRRTRAWIRVTPVERLAAAARYL